MENPDPRSKRTLRRNNNYNNNSMSDTESTASQAESWHSPLPSPAFLRENERSIVPIDKHYSPGKSNLTAANKPKTWRTRMTSEKRIDFPVSPAEAAVNFGRRETTVAENRDGVKKVGEGVGRVEEGYGGDRDGENGEMFGKSSSEESAAARKAALVLRIIEMAVCVISFSVMAKDKTQGWSGDSYDRYIEYRYCLGVNIIGFVYSGIQTYDLAYHFGTGKRLISSNLCYYLSFGLDQIVAYLLVSASSSAATRVNDWISNWGKDEFTFKATLSIAMSFIAFFAFAFSSLLSAARFYLST